MPRCRSLRTNVIAALTLCNAAFVAALFSHVVIDLAGDVVLAHDAYDGLDHRSRSDVCMMALTLAMGALLRLVWRALDEARTGRAVQRLTLDDLYGSKPWRFVCAVVVLTLPALMTMELWDVVIDGRRCDDVTDLLGGSAWLGLSVTIPVAALVALAVRLIAKLALGSHRALVTAFGLFLALLTQLHPRIGVQSVAPRSSARLRRRSVLSRRSGKRGPPLHAA